MTLLRNLKNLNLALVTLAASFGGSAVTADTIELTGTIRDFQRCHPDMQNPNTSKGLRTGIVQTQLGADGLPVLTPGFDLASAMINSEASFNQWFRDIPGVNIAIPYTFTLDNGQDEPGGVYSFARERGMSGDLEYFFPADGQGWNEAYNGADGKLHNFYFTFEVRTSFTYTDPSERVEPMIFRFVGDDDVWVFINGRLAVDIGGVHVQEEGSVDLDATAASLGLVPGESYELVLFFAERHLVESNFRIETNMLLEGVAPTTVSPLFD